MGTYTVSTLDFYGQWTNETFGTWADAQDYLVSLDSCAEIEVNDIDIVTGHGGCTWQDAIEFTAEEAEKFFCKAIAVGPSLDDLNDDGDDDEAEYDAIVMQQPGESPVLNAVMTAAEVATTFQISGQAVRQACESGLLECRKAGGTWLITRSSAAARWTREQVVNDSRLLHWSVSRIDIDPADAQIVTETSSSQTVRYGRMWAYRIAGLDFHADIAETGRVELPSGRILRWDRAANAGDPSHVWYESN